MEHLDSSKLEFIDETSSQSEEYVWKKKKAVQKGKTKDFIVTKEVNKVSFIKNVSSEDTFSDENLRISFNTDRDGKSIVEDVFDISGDKSGISEVDSSLSPKAPLGEIDGTSTDGPSFHESQCSDISDDKLLLEDERILDTEEKSNYEENNFEESNNDLNGVNDIKTYLNVNKDLLADVNNSGDNSLTEDLPHGSSETENDKVVYDISLNEDILFCVVFKESTSKTTSSVLINDVTDRLEATSSNELNSSSSDGSENPHNPKLSSEYVSVQPTTGNIASEEIFRENNEQVMPIILKEVTDCCNESQVELKLEVDNTTALIIPLKEFDYESSSLLGNNDTDLNGELPNATSTPVKCSGLPSLSDINNSVYYECENSQLHSNKDDFTILSNENDYFISVDNLFDRRPCQTLIVKDLEEYANDNTSENNNLNVQEISNFVETNFSFLKDEYNDPSSPSLLSFEDKCEKEKSDKDVAVQTTITLLETIAIVNSEDTKSVKGNYESNFNVITDDRKFKNNDNELSKITENCMESVANDASSVIPDMLKNLETDLSLERNILEESYKLYSDSSVSIENLSSPTTSTKNKDTKEIIKDTETKDSDDELEIKTSIMEGTNCEKLIVTEGSNFYKQIQSCKPDVICQLDNGADICLNVPPFEITTEKDKIINSIFANGSRDNIEAAKNDFGEISLVLAVNTSDSETNQTSNLDCVPVDLTVYQNDYTNVISDVKNDSLNDTSFTLSEISEDTDEYCESENEFASKINNELHSVNLRAEVDEKAFIGMMEECAWGEFQNKAVEVLSMFRRRLMPGVTNASDWIGFCEKENDKDDVLYTIEENNEGYDDSEFETFSCSESEGKRSSSFNNSEAECSFDDVSDELQFKIVKYEKEDLNSPESISEMQIKNLSDVKSVKFKYQELLSNDSAATDGENYERKDESIVEEQQGQKISGVGTCSNLLDIVVMTNTVSDKSNYRNDSITTENENDKNERKRLANEDDEVRTEEETGVEPSRPCRRRKEHLASDRSLVSTCAAEQAHCGAAEMVFSVELECGLEEGLRSPDSVVHTSGTLCSELPSATTAAPFGYNCPKEDQKQLAYSSVHDPNDSEISVGTVSDNHLPCSSIEINLNQCDRLKFSFDNLNSVSDRNSSLCTVLEGVKNSNYNPSKHFNLQKLNNSSKHYFTPNEVDNGFTSNSVNKNNLISESNGNFLLLIENNAFNKYDDSFKCSVDLKCVENTKKNVTVKHLKDVLVQDDVDQLTVLQKEDESGKGLQVGGEEEDVSSRGTLSDATSLEDTSENSPSGVVFSDSIECVVTEGEVTNNPLGNTSFKYNEEDSNEGNVLNRKDDENNVLTTDKNGKGCDDKYFNLVDNVLDKRHCINLFQFNKSEIKNITSYLPDVSPRLNSEETSDEMRQKKKAEVDSSEEATVDGSGDCCNGYHRGTLKSALKRNTKSKSSKKKHRVQFDESLNKFFDADYVILIREDPEDGEGVCECGEELCYDCTEDEDLGLPEEVQSPRFDLCAAFEPPMEFVDQVTLSPPDGYKDISQGCCPHHFHQRRLRPDDREGWEEGNPVSRPDVKESKNEEEEIEPSGSGADTETGNDNLIPANEHASPSTPLPTNALHHHQQLQHHQQSLQQTPSQSQQQQRYIVETITMTTVTERRIVREADDQIQSKGDGNVDGDAKLSGILKGGKLWKSTDSDDSQSKPEQQWSTPDDPDGRRSVRFCDGQTDTEDLPAPPPTELTLTFKLGNHVMVSNNSSRPNSAVRQLFPAQRFMSPPPQPNRSPDSEDPTKTDPKYLVTTENLRLFDESKKSKIKQYFQPGSTKNKDGSSQTVTSPQQESQAFAPASDDEDSLQNNLIKRTIERNTLRRSLLRYPHDSARLKRNQNKMKTENSLVERIKQLTCDVEEEQIASGDEKQTEENPSSVMPPRTSPPGEEAKPFPIKSEKIASSSGMSSTYKKLTDLFTRRSDKPESHPHNSMILQTPASIEHQYPYYQPVYQQATSPPDLGNGLNTHNLLGKNNLIARTNSTTEARKQFLSTLAPLTACVSGSGEDSPVNKETPGDRNSVASTSTCTAADTEYSLDDIEEALVDEPGKTAPQPDVVAGTPAGDTQDELALFVQQDASRIERLRKRYGSTPAPSTAASEDDEQDDYGFNRRPSVRGIKPRFGSTTEILQQMQSQLQPPPPPGSHVSWPYYSPDIDPRMGRGSGNRNQMPILKEDGGFAYVQADSPIPEYPSSSPVDGSTRYQHLLYSSTGNLHQPMRIGGGGTIHHVHSESPPPGVMVPLQEVPGQMYTRRALPGGSLVQMQVPVPVRLPHYAEDPHYPATSIIRVGQGQQQTIRVPYPSGTPVQVHLLATRRGDSPQRPPHLVVARGTQTSSISTTYYQLPPPPPRTSYPLSIRGPLVYSATHDKPPHLAPYTHARSSSPTIIPSLTSSPTRMKPHATERGVPEGAASSSPAFPQDSVYSVQVSTSTNIPSPQDIDITNRMQGNNNSTQPPNNPVFYAMNV